MAKNISKADFIRLVQDQYNQETECRITVLEAENVVNAVFGALKSSLSDGYKVRMYRFGSFNPVVKPARNGRNPQTGEYIRIPERASVKFLPSPTLLGKIK